VFILSFPVRLERVCYAIGYAYGYGFYACCGRDTYAPARFGELPLLSVPSKTDSRAAHTFPEGPKRSFNKVD
jgi:hypothetical protein